MPWVLVLSMFFLSVMFHTVTSPLYSSSLFQTTWHCAWVTLLWLLPPSSPSLSVRSSPTGSTPFTYKPNNPEATRPSINPIRFSYTLDYYLPAAITQGQISDKRQPLCPRAHWNYSNLAYPKSSYLPLSIPSHKTTSRLLLTFLPLFMSCDGSIWSSSK